MHKNRPYNGGRYKQDPPFRKNLFDAVSPHLKTLKKTTKPTAQTVPILLEEAKASLLRYAQKPRSKFGFLGF